MKRNICRLSHVAIIALLVLYTVDILQLDHAEVPNRTVRQVHAQGIDDKGSKYQDLKNWSAANVKLTKTIEAAAKESKLDLGPDIKDLLVRHLIRETAGQGISFDKISVSPTRTRDVTSMLATTAKGEKLTLQEVEAKLAEWKLDRTLPKIPGQIEISSRLAGVKLTKEALKLIRSDLVSRTKSMAESHMRVDDIHNKNTAYLNTVFAAAPGSILDAKSYIKVRQTVFPKIVRLTIKSIPESANVEVNGIHIGRTIIEGKPFEASQTYVFLFTLAGFKEDRRQFHVLPDQATEEVVGLLLPIHNK